MAKRKELLDDEDRVRSLRMYVVREEMRKAPMKPDGSLYHPHHPFAEAARTLARRGIHVRDTTLAKQWQRMKQRLGDAELNRMLDNFAESERDFVIQYLSEHQIKKSKTLVSALVGGSAHKD